MESTATKVSRRELLAQIVLADLPLPVEIDFQPVDGEVCLVFPTIATGQAWIEHLGGRPELRDYHDGRTYLSTYSRLALAGWPVHISANEPTAQTPEQPELDGDTRAELSAVATTTKPAAAWVLVCDAGNLPTSTTYPAEPAANAALALHRVECTGGHTVHLVSPAPELAGAGPR